MSLPQKLPKLSPYVEDEIMTETDWEHYFELRKERDHFVSQADKTKLTQLSINSYENKDWETHKKIGRMLPLKPSLAIAAKNTFGIKSVQELNLYDAKQRYPDEF